MVIHSDLEMTLQVMTGSSKNPLTPGRWVHMGLKNDKIEIFQPGGYTKKIFESEILHELLLYELSSSGYFMETSFYLQNIH